MKLRRVGCFAFVSLVLIVFTSLFVWRYFLRTVPPTGLERIEDQFAYGSIGVEYGQPMPYPIWVVLPRVFPEFVPGPRGYTSFGFPWKEGHELPIGFAKTTVGFPRVSINCALCHTSTYRVAPEDSQHIAYGGVSSTVNIQGYVRFLHKCANSPRFTADVLLPEIEYLFPLSVTEKLLYRSVLIPQTKKALQEDAKHFAWTNERPDWGHGRIDPFNPVKFGILGLSDDKSIGNSDMMPLWNLLARKGHPFHLDGLNDNLFEVFASSALGDGTPRNHLPLEHLAELTSWTLTLQPPKYPFPINPEKAARGHQLYVKVGCAECHDVGGKQYGSRINPEQLCTDEARLGMWSQEAADRYNHYTADYDWQLKRFVKEKGYVATPLTGLWLRGPYLHNGSVPTVKDLLTSASLRPKSFYRGYDVLDNNNLGYVSSVESENGVAFTHYSVQDSLGHPIPGNTNTGHEGPEFGTGLAHSEKEDLLEYLKTL